MFIGVIVFIEGGIDWGMVWMLEGIVGYGLKTGTIGIGFIIVGRFVA